jgi:transcriptional antiterminator NusG
MDDRDLQERPTTADDEPADAFAELDASPAPGQGQDDLTTMEPLEDEQVQDVVETTGAGDVAEEDERTATALEADQEEALVERAERVDGDEPTAEVAEDEADEVELEAGSAEPESVAVETDSAPTVEADNPEREPEPEAAAPEPEPEAAPEPEPSILRGPGEWYVVHTYSGYENKVKTNLHQRIGSMQMEDKIFDVVIPLEDVMEIKGGKKQVVQRKVFPGYLLVRMIYDNDSWYVVRNTPGVTGFVSSGTGTKPTPLSAREVEKILAVKQETAKKPEYRLEWEEGDVVRIIAGPFADFTGTISEINVEQSKLRVMVNIFDRETPVELAFDQVAKA